jgi:hypothetical protein
VVGLVTGDFAATWDGLPSGFPDHTALAYSCATISLACGLGLFWRRTATIAARLLLAFVALWLLLVKGRFIVLAPLVEGSYQSAAETAVIVAGAWVLYARLAGDWDRRRIGFAIGANGCRVARALYGLALIAFGLSHFAYLNMTAPLVPGWLPWHVGWAYFTGSAFLAAGVAVLTGVYARLAAALSTLQMILFIPLVWLPIVATGNASAFRWGELLVSCVVAAGAWLVTESYGDVPWRAVGRRHDVASAWRSDLTSCSR